VRGQLPRPRKPLNYAGRVSTTQRYVLGVALVIWGAVALTGGLRWATNFHGAVKHRLQRDADGRGRPAWLVEMTSRTYVSRSQVVMLRIVGFFFVLFGLGALLFGIAALLA
jgi:hypothetical protein